jgi:hypothetical protein
MSGRRPDRRAAGGDPVCDPAVFGDNCACPARTFAEQPPGLTARYGRRTSLLTGMLAAIAVALAGRAGARLASRLGMPTSKDSLLRVPRRLPDPAVDQLSVVGVDDFAPRRGHVYGSVALNMVTHARSICSPTGRPTP